MTNNLFQRSWLDVLRRYGNADVPRLVADAEAGDQDAQVLLAQRVIEGNIDSSSFSPAQAIELLETASLAGNPRAQLLLGRSYWFGFDVPTNHSKAFFLISTSADQGYAYALEALAGLYFEGIGCKQSFSQTRDLVMRAEASEIDFYERIRLGGNALTLGEYKLAVMGRLNNVSFEFVDDQLEALSRWKLDLNRAFLKMQIENKTVRAARHNLNLPHFGIGGVGWHYVLAGEGTVSRLGVYSSYLKSECWFDLRGKACGDANFPEFTELNEIEVNIFGEISKALIEKLKQTLPSVQTPSMLERLRYCFQNIKYGERYKKPEWRRISDGTTEIAFFGNMDFSGLELEHCDGRYVNKRLVSLTLE